MVPSSKEIEKLPICSGCASGCSSSCYRLYFPKTTKPEFQQQIFPVPSLTSKKIISSKYSKGDKSILHKIRNPSNMKVKSKRRVKSRSLHCLTMARKLDSSIVEELTEILQRFKIFRIRKMSWSEKWDIRFQRKLNQFIGE